MHHLVVAQRACAYDARDHQTGGKKGEKEAGAAFNSEFLPTVYESVAYDGQGFPPALKQEESVQRQDFLVGNGLAAGKFDCCVQYEPCKGESHAKPEEGFEITVEQIEHIDGHHRAEHHRKIVAQAVVADSLTTSGGWQYIYGNGTGSYRSCSERSSVQSPEKREKSNGTGKQIASEQQEKHEVADYQDGPARKAVYQISTERPHQQSHHGIAGKRQSYGILSGPEGLAEV